MECNEYEIKVPGKLFIAGEYAAVEPGYESIVVAVDRYITARIKETEESIINLYDIGLEQISYCIKDSSVHFSTTDDRISFVKESFQVVFEYLQGIGLDMKSFTLDITSGLNDEKTGMKYGLGSSAAIVVGTISAILAIHQKANSKLKFHQDKELIFKLAAIAHVKVQGNGSGADIAAAVYGGWINYKSFDAKWLLKKIQLLRKVTDILDIPWIHLSHTKITPPRSLRLMVGWTKEACTTKGMVSKVNDYKEEHLMEYHKFLKESKAAVTRILSGFDMERLDICIDGMKKNHIALKELGTLSEVPIITEDMNKLCNIANQYGAGKSSGAGGGDCGIAFVREEHVYILQSKWKDQGIVNLPITVDYNGLMITKRPYSMLVG